MEDIAMNSVRRASIEAGSVESEQILCRRFLVLVISQSQK